MDRRARLRILMLTGVGLAAAALAAGAYALDVSRSTELATVDTRFSIRGTEPPPEDMVVVEIDAETLQDLGRLWPFPRRYHARVLDQLVEDGARAIAFDVQFSELSDDGDEDAFSLLDAVARARNVVLSTTEVDEFGNPNIFVPYIDQRLAEEGRDPAEVPIKDFLREELHAEPGNTSLPTDPNGTLRRITYDVDGLKSFGVAAAEVANGGRIDRDDVERHGDAYVDYHGPPGTFDFVPYSNVLRGQFRRGRFRDKIVVIGPSAPSLQDVHPTSTTGDSEMAGAEIQANAISTARRGFPLNESPAWLDYALIVLLGLATPLASLRFSAVVSLLVALAIGVVFAIVVQLAFQGGMILPFIYPLGALVISAVGALAIHYVTTAFERERVRDVFSRFVSDAVVDDVLAQAEGARLGGVSREATVMFSDLRGFTSFAEQLPPDRVIELLNRYLGSMSDAILEHGGTLVDFMGDGIMAVFGAPVDQPDHADRALAAAREKLRRLEQFNDSLAAEGIDKRFQMGIGLNTGTVMSGNVGSEQRLAYTAIGDTTNTASRIEGMTKPTPHQLLLAESTRAALMAQPDDLVDAGEFEVRGRVAKIHLWSVEQARKDVVPEQPAA